MLFSLICLRTCVRMYTHTGTGRVNLAVSLVIHQMSQPKQNTIPGHTLGDNTHRYRNPMHAWKKKYSEGGKKTCTQ